MNIYKPDCVRQRTNWSDITGPYQFEKPNFNPNVLKQDIPSHSPKLERLLQHIRQLDEEDLRNHGFLHKHFIFTDLKSSSYGAKMIASGLIADGRVMGFEKAKNGNLSFKSDAILAKTSYHNVLLLSSVAVYGKPMPSAAKKQILAKFNQRPENVYGENIRFIVLDSGFKEGIDLYDVKYVHIFEPPSNMADQKQVIGRGTRKCGQAGLIFHPTRGWPLHVFIYDMTIPPEIRPNLMFAESMFDLYLKAIQFDIRLLNFAKELEDATIYGAVDYELTRKIHSFRPNEKKSNSASPSPSVKKTTETQVMEWPKKRMNHLELRDFVHRFFLSCCEWKNIRMENKCSYIKPALRPKLTANRIEEMVSSASSPSSPSPLSIASTQSASNIPNRSSSSTRKSYKSVSTVGGSFLKFEGGGLDFEKNIAAGGIFRLNEGGAAGLDCEQQAKRVVAFSPTQEFIHRYFTPQNPLKGMLLWQGTGVGKTCTAIATATDSFERQGYTILWVTRTTLKEDIWKNMFDTFICHEGFRERLAKCELDIPTEPRERMNLLSKAWNIRPMSYKQFSNLVSKKNSLYEDLVKRNGEGDPLRKSLLIIDESHKLYGGNDLIANEKPDMKALHTALMHSYNVSGNDSVKVLLMTATPITVDPMELIQLVNLCKPMNEQMADTFPAFTDRYLDEETGLFTEKGKQDYLDDIAGHISYLNLEKDAREFSQPIVEPVHVPLVENVENVERFLNKNEAAEKAYVEGKQTEIAKIQQDVTDIKQVLDHISATYIKSYFTKAFEGFCKDEEDERQCSQIVNRHVVEAMNDCKPEFDNYKSQSTFLKQESKVLEERLKEHIQQVKDQEKKDKPQREAFQKSPYFMITDRCAMESKDEKSLEEQLRLHPFLLEVDQELAVIGSNYGRLKEQVDLAVKEYESKTHFLQQLPENVRKAEFDNNAKYQQAFRELSGKKEAMAKDLVAFKKQEKELLGKKKKRFEYLRKQWLEQARRIFEEEKLAAKSKKRTRKAAVHMDKKETKNKTAKVTAKANKAAMKGGNPTSTHLIHEFVNDVIDKHLRIAREEWKEWKENKLREKAEKEAKEREKAREKAEKEAKEKAEKEAKEREKEAIKVAKEREKAEKEAKEQEKAAKEKEKAAKEQEKAREKEAIKVAKEQEKVAKEQEKATKEQEKEAAKAVENEKPVKPPRPVKPVENEKPVKPTRKRKTDSMPSRAKTQKKRGPFKPFTINEEMRKMAAEKAAQYVQLQKKQLDESREKLIGVSNQIVDLLDTPRNDLGEQK